MQTDMLLSIRCSQGLAGSISIRLGFVDLCPAVLL